MPTEVQQLKAELDALRLRVIRLESTTRGMQRGITALKTVDKPDLSVVDSPDVEHMVSRLAGDLAKRLGLTDITLTPEQREAEVQSRRDIELRGLRVVNEQLLAENAKLRGDIEYLHREASRLRGLKLTAEDALANDQHVIEALRKELRQLTAETMRRVNADRLVTEAPVLTDPWEGLTDRQPRSHGNPVRG